MAHLPISPAARRSAKRGHDEVDSEHGRPETRLSKKLRAASVSKAPKEVLAVLVFGNGDAGELGLGPRVQEAGRARLIPTLDPDDPAALHAVQIACGGMHTVVLTKDNKIVTWGVNDNGALGRNATWEGEMRDVDGDDDLDGELNPLESTPTPIPPTSFPPDTTFLQVAAGDSCSFALTETGLVYGWGTFKDPQGEERFGYDDKGNLVKRQAMPTRIRGLKDITQVACGSNHALALDAYGVVWSWGCGEQGQLGRNVSGPRGGDPLAPSPAKVRDIKHIGAGDYHSLAVDGNGHGWGWGLNSFGQAGHAKTAGTDQGAIVKYPTRIPSFHGKGVVCLAGGAHHSAAVTAEGECLVWGRLDGGQLGIPFSPEQLQNRSLIRYDERNKPRICLVPTRVPHIGQVSHVACGTDHTIFVARDGTAYATGFNSQKQLGLGHDDDVDVAQLIQAKALKDRVLTWAGAGGQFSIVAARS